MSRNIDALRRTGAAAALAFGALEVAPVLSAEPSDGQTSVSVVSVDLIENGFIAVLDLTPVTSQIGQPEIFAGSVPPAILPEDSRAPIRVERSFEPKDGLRPDHGRPQLLGIRQGSTLSSHGNRTR